jgi:hypothetical protein
MVIGHLLELWVTKLLQIISFFFLFQAIYYLEFRLETAQNDEFELCYHYFLGVSMVKHPFF